MVSNKQVVIFCDWSHKSRTARLIILTSRSRESDIFGRSNRDSARHSRSRFLSGFPIVIFPAMKKIAPANPAAASNNAKTIALKRKIKNSAIIAAAKKSATENEIIARQTGKGKDFFFICRHRSGMLLLVFFAILYYTTISNICQTLP